MALVEYHRARRLYYGERDLACGKNIRIAVTVCCATGSYPAKKHSFLQDFADHRKVYHSLVSSFAKINIWVQSEHTFLVTSIGINSACLLATLCYAMPSNIVLIRSDGSCNWDIIPFFLGLALFSSLQ